MTTTESNKSQADPHPTAWRVSLTSSNLRSLAQPSNFKLEHTVSLTLAHLTTTEICSSGQICKWFCVNSEDNRLWALLVQRDYPLASTSSIFGYKSLYQSLTTNIQRLHYGGPLNHRFNFMVRDPTTSVINTISNAPLFGSTYHTFHTNATLKNQEIIRGTNVSNTNAIFEQRVRKLMTGHNSISPFPSITVGITCDYKTNQSHYSDQCQQLVVDFICKCGFGIGTDGSKERMDLINTNRGYVGMFVDGCPFLLVLQYEQCNQGNDLLPPLLQPPPPPGEEKESDPRKDRNEEKESDPGILAGNWRTTEDKIAARAYTQKKDKKEQNTPAELQARRDQTSTPDVWVHLINTRGENTVSMKDSKLNILKERALDPLKNEIPLIVLATGGMQDSESANEEFAKGQYLSEFALKKAAASKAKKGQQQSRANEEQLLLSSLFTFRFRALKDDPEINAAHVYEVSLNGPQTHLTNTLVEIGKIGLKGRGTTAGSEWETFNRWTNRISTYKEAVLGRPGKKNVGKNKMGTGRPSSCGLQ